jgi:hypothetical protein
LADYSILDYGAVGDGETLDTQAIQQAIDACHGAGGGRVVLPAGRTYRSGSLWLRGCVDLHVERGATLAGSEDIDDYTAQAFPKADDPDRRGWAMIVADGADDIAITGGGVIDGRGVTFMADLRQYHYKPTHRRPHLVRLSEGQRITIRDITLRDSANWALHLSGCEDVVIHAIRILNDLRLPNCDGIDPDHCRRVRISDCYIQAGDDCIVIKNRLEAPDAGPSEDITITNCVLMSTSTAIKIGTESIDDFRNIVITGCVIRSSNRGLSIQLRDRGTVENVLFANCTVETRYFAPNWWGRSEPIYVTAIHRAPGTALGRVRNVRFQNLLCRSENGVFIAGSEDSPIEGLVLDGVRVEIDKWSKWPGGMHDRRPCMVDDSNFAIDPEKDKGLVEHPTAGVYAEHARDLTLRNVQVAWGANEQDFWSHALEAHHVQTLRMDGFDGSAGRAGTEALLLDDAHVPTTGS